MLASDWEPKYFLCPSTDKHSNESWNWFAKRSIPGLSRPLLKPFAAVFPDPNNHPWVFHRHYSYPTDRPWLSEDGVNLSRFLTEDSEYLS